MKDLMGAKTRLVTYVQACNLIFASKHGLANSSANFDMKWLGLSCLTMSSTGMEC